MVEQSKFIKIRKCVNLFKILFPFFTSIILIILVGKINTFYSNKSLIKNYFYDINYSN